MRDHRPIRVAGPAFLTSASLVLAALGVLAASGTAEAGGGGSGPVLLPDVIVRPLTPFGMESALRVTVGTPEENRRLVRALRAVLGTRAA